MLAPNRRWERREEILEQVVREGRFRVSRTVDLTHREAEGKFLEGTGSVVLDRAHRVAYASLVAAHRSGRARGVRATAGL